MTGREGILSVVHEQKVDRFSHLPITMMRTGQVFLTFSRVAAVSTRYCVDIQGARFLLDGLAARAPESGSRARPLLTPLDRSTAATTRFSRTSVHPQSRRVIGSMGCAP
jgi:hypothetical protein